MPTSKVNLGKRVAELERQLEEIRTMMAAQAVVSAAQPAPAKAMAAAAAAGAAVAPAAAPAAAKKSPVAPPKANKEEANKGVSHEVLVVLAAAVAQFLGKSVRIRSARLVHPTGMSPWAQQGRVFVQASHNLGLAR